MSDDNNRIVDVFDENRPIPPTRILQELQIFLEEASAKRLNRSLHKVFYDYLLYNKEELPLFHEDLLSDLYWLFKLLDVAEDETADWPCHN